VAEKDNISADIKTLQKLHKDFISKIDDLKYKYEHLMKSKSLMKLEKERLLRERDNKLTELNKLQQELEKVKIIIFNKIK
jgi:hypothetical protein